MIVKSYLFLFCLIIASPADAIPKVFIPSCQELLSKVYYHLHNNFPHNRRLPNLTPSSHDLDESYWAGRNKIKNPLLDFLVAHGVAIRRNTFVFEHWENYKNWEQAMTFQAGRHTARTATKAISKALGRSKDGKSAFNYARIYEDPKTHQRVAIDLDQVVPEGFKPFVVNKTTSKNNTEFVNLDNQTWLLAQRKFFLALDDFFYHDLGHGLGFVASPEFYEAIVQVSKDLQIPNTDGISVFHDSYKKAPERDAKAMDALNSRYFQVMELSHATDSKYKGKMKYLSNPTKNSNTIDNAESFKPTEVKKFLSENLTDKQLKRQLKLLTYFYDKYVTKTGGVSVDIYNAVPTNYQDTMPGAAVATRLMKYTPPDYNYDRASLINRIVLMQGELIGGLHYSPALQARAMLVPDRFPWLSKPTAEELEATNFYKRIYNEEPAIFKMYSGWDR